MRSTAFLGYVMVLPGILMVAVLTLYPLITLIMMTFSNVEFTLAGVKYTYVGLKNFHQLANDPNFAVSIRTTVIFSIVCVVIQIILGIFLALLFSQIRFARFFRTTLLITMMLPPVTVALIFRTILNADFGLVNTFLAIFGVARIDWLGDPSNALVSIILVDTWHWASFVFLIILAGILALPIEPYEAAKIDGASRLNIFRFITLPFLRPTIFIALLFRGTDILQVFPEVWVLTFGGPSFSTTILNILVYLAGFSWFNWGYAAAVSMIMLAIGSSIILLTLWRRR